MTDDVSPALWRYVHTEDLHRCSRCLDPVLVRLCERVAGGDTVRVWCCRHSGTELAIVSTSAVEDGARQWYFLDGPGEPIQTREDREREQLRAEVERLRAARSAG